MCKHNKTSKNWNSGSWNVFQFPFINFVNEISDPKSLQRILFDFEAVKGSVVVLLFPLRIGN